MYNAITKALMPRHTFVAALCCGALAALSVQADKVFAQSFSSGKALAQAVYDRPDGDTLFALSKMSLTEKNRKPRVRSYVVFGEEKKDGEKASLIRFKYPGEVNGTGLLTLDYADKSNDQWLYLPDLKKVRRIASSNKDSRFVGSDIYYEDLEDRLVEEDTHTLLGEKKVNDTTCLELESIPISEGSSIYTRRVSCVHPEILLPLSAQFYNKKGLVKRMEVLRVENIQGYWTVMDYVLTDAKSQHETRIVLDKVIYDMPFDNLDVFSTQVLEDPVKDQKVSKKLLDQ